MFAFLCKPTDGVIKLVLKLSDSFSCSRNSWSISSADCFLSTSVITGPDFFDLDPSKMKFDLTLVETKAGCPTVYFSVKSSSTSFMITVSILLKVNLTRLAYSYSSLSFLSF